MNRVLSLIRCLELFGVGMRSQTSQGIFCRCLGRDWFAAIGTVAIVTLTFHNRIIPEFP